MITLHRLGHVLEAFQLNSELIMTVEANPDTVITLTNGHKVVVAETPERVAEEVRAQRVEVLAGAMERRAALRASGHSARRRGGLLTAQPGGADVTPLPVSSSDSPTPA
ncbi:MAG TPA: flagellar FlbD family protein [Solirubrobacteraceae bacterium]|nr:flagellar FlbD family protein [Solirubrobacteraceae bacterium]